MKYTALTIVNLASGSVVGLTEQQANVRSHAIVPLADRPGWYTATAPIQLKVGERFEYEGDIPKAMADSLATEDGKTVAAAIQERKREDVAAVTKAKSERKAK